MGNIQQSCHDLAIMKRKYTYPTVQQENFRAPKRACRPIPNTFNQSGQVDTYANVTHQFSSDNFITLNASELKKSSWEIYQKGMECFNKCQYKQALLCFKHAADQGLPEAYTTLGECYSQGYGVPTDHHHAVMWLQFSRQKNYKT